MQLLPQQRPSYWAHISRELRLRIERRMRGNSTALLIFFLGGGGAGDLKAVKHGDLFTSDLQRFEANPTG